MPEVTGWSGSALTETGHVVGEHGTMTVEGSLCTSKGCLGIFLVAPEHTHITVIMSP